MTQLQMLEEAQKRQVHNKQRAQLRRLLNLQSTDGSTVTHNDLMLAAKLAKMELPQELLFKSDYSNRHVVKRTKDGAPEKIEWRKFCQNIDFPTVQDPDAAGEHYRQREADMRARRAARQKAEREAQEAAAAARAAAEAVTVRQHANVKTEFDLRPGVTPNELRSAQKFLRDRIETKYKRITDAFKAHDTARDGLLGREEVKEMIYNFNCNHIKPSVIDTLIDFVDFDGDGQIKYSEFARVLTADDVMNMKPTLTAVADAIKVGAGDRVIHTEHVRITSNAVQHRNHAANTADFARQV